MSIRTATPNPARSTPADRKQVGARRVVFGEPGVVEIETYEPETLGKGQVRVRPLLTAISPGTELAWLHAKPNTPGRFPLYPGYTGVGEISEIADDIESFQVGDRVAAKLRHASDQVLEASACHPLPKGLEPRQAAGFRLASIALQGVRKAQVQLGETVAVAGLGPIGLLAAQWCRVAGAAEVTAADPQPSRRETAERCGAHRTVPALSEDAEAMYDLIVEATGLPDVIRDSLCRVADGGRLVLLGSPRGTVDGVDFYRDIHRRGVTLVGAHERLRPADPTHADSVRQTHHRDEATSLAYAAADRLDLDVLITDTRPAEQAASVYEQLAQPGHPHLCIALDWSS